MVVVAKDAAQQLYRAVFSKLTLDGPLNALLESSVRNPKVFQDEIDFDTAEELKLSYWITFRIVNDDPDDVEQMQDIRNIDLAVSIWARGPGSDKAEEIEKRVRQLLDDGDLATPQLFVWVFYSTGYRKNFDLMARLWHITSTYRVKCMAIEEA